MEQRRAEFNDNADHDLYFDFIFQNGIFFKKYFLDLFCFRFWILFTYRIIDRRADTNLLFVVVS